MHAHSKFLTKEEWWHKIYNLPSMNCDVQQLHRNKCWVSGGKKTAALQSGVSRSSSVTKASLTCPPFMSRGSQGMPFSILTVFSHLSSVSSISEGPLFFLNAHKKNDWDLGRERMVFCTNMEIRKGKRNPRMMGKIDDIVYFQINFKDHKELMRWKDAIKIRSLHGLYICIWMNTYICMNECLYTHTYTYVHSHTQTAWRNVRKTYGKLAS